MIDIYEIDSFGQWTGVTDQIDEKAGCTSAWVRAPRPPEVGQEEAAVWAIGRWHVQTRLNADDLVDAPPPEA